MIVPFHTLLGVVALLAGAWNLLTRKGTRRHRAVGWVYTGSMAGLIATSFLTYEMFDGFGPFHWMAVVSGATLALAIYFPIRRARHANWLEHHYWWITYSYVGLLMATGSHLFALGPPGWPGWAKSLLYWGAPYVIGSALIFGLRRRILARFAPPSADG
jgi:uncharacterized membrane protein